MHTDIIEQKTEDFSLSEMDADSLREHVLMVTKDFKNSWRNLAKVLQTVWKDKVFKQWGYETFDQYTAKEVHIRKHTAMKLIRSYQFLEKEGPAYISSDYDSQENSEVPSHETVYTLQRAKKNLSDEEYQKVKKDVLKEKKDIGQVKKDLTALILRRRKDINPDQERTRVARVAISKFISTLRSFKQDIETLQILPENIADEISRLIQSIEAQR
jgi:hypothetical protein